MRIGEWYETAFGADYLQRYAHRNSEEARRAAKLVLRHLPGGFRGPVLDLCCGAGRHALVLAGGGCEVVGGDLSMPLLRAARSAAAAESRVLPLVRLDMRQLPFASGSFRLVTNFFTAFGYFDDDEENFGVFEEVARLLQPGGWFLLDFINRETAIHAVAQSPHEEYPSEQPGATWLVDRCLTPDGRRAQKHQQEWADGALRREVWESVRLYSPADLKGALAERSLSVTQCWGDYTGEPLDEQASPRCILLARRT